MSKPKTQTSNPLLWLRSHKLYSLFIAVVVLIVGFFVYERIALELNKRAFNNARSTINTIYENITREIGTPDESKTADFCDSSHQEFTENPISCNVETVFIYSVSDINQANETMSKIQKIIKEDNKFIVIGKPSKNITSSTVLDATYSSAIDHYKSNRLYCTVSYWFETPRQIELSILDKNKKPLEISISCGGLARGKYYPIIN